MVPEPQETLVAAQNPLRSSASSCAVPTCVRYRVMAFLCALSFLTYFDRVCIVRAQPDIQRDLFLSDNQMGLVLGAFWLAYGLFEIPSGWMGDRFGPRLALLRIVLAWSLFTALSGTAIGFASLLVFRFLFGFGEEGAYPNMAVVQSRWVPAKGRARFAGVLWLSARWGGAFSPIIFGWLAREIDSPGFRSALAAIPLLEKLQHAASWRFGFWAAGSLGLMWCAAFYPWFRNEPSQSPETNQAERDLLAAEQTGASGSHQTSRDVWRALFRSSSLWAMAVLYFCGSFGWSFFVSWAPRYLKDVHGVRYENSEWLAALPLFVGGISCLVGGNLCDWLVQRTNRKRLVRAIFPVSGCLLAAAAMFGIRFVSSTQHVAVLLCVAAAAYDFGQSANWATIVDIGGCHAGIAAGFINMVGNLANFAQPVIGPHLFNTFGWNALFLVYAAAFLFAAGMWLFIDPERAFYEAA